MTTYNVATNAREGSRVELEAPLMPARAFFYAVVEEVGQNGFLVRKVYEVLDEATLEQSKLPIDVLKNEMNPERKGINYRAPDSNISIAGHVKGNKFSKYMSATDFFPSGSPRLDGRVTYVDIEKALRAGARIVSQDAIQRDLDRHLLKYPHTRIKTLEAKDWARIDREVLLNGKPVPASAIFNPETLPQAQGYVRVGRVIQVVGIFFTAYDLKVAASESMKLQSIKPISQEVLRQAGGWAGAVAGAKLGASVGVTYGVVTGPGVIVTGLVGGVLFGAMGYFGADHLAQRAFE
ncbi:hypothetical protein D9X30_5884 [Cupriavidus sp. U2]|uniref:glycine zipper family protein n=1 Tax=Cupriavidus sp. U2 TaxID=2920269 RepID=UPI00129DE0E8|nr:glycine zipper family protein [Cupriavidus sp. U2]KAI3589072.1 hypothetical protein D9X30_5884 [Cupriavidus sp. U2]